MVIKSAEAGKTVCLEIRSRSKLVFVIRGFPELHPWLTMESTCWFSCEFKDTETKTCSLKLWLVLAGQNMNCYVL